MSRWSGVRTTLAVPVAVSVFGVAAVVPATGATQPAGPITAISIPISVSATSMDGAVTDLGVDNRDFRLASDVLFDFDKATLKPRAKTEITRIVRLLLAPQPAGSTRGAVKAVKVAGHTDSVGSDAYNLKLSQRRAEAVRAALEKQLGSAITVTGTGLGETTPIASNSTKAGQAKNRRVEIVAS